MSNNQKSKKKKVPLSYDKKKELAYIITIAVLATTIVVMFSLKFADRIFSRTPEEQKVVLSNGEYYQPADPYEIPNRSEEDIKNLYENEIIISDIYYRMSIPFGVGNGTVEGEYTDLITKRTGLDETAPYVSYVSYAQSLWMDDVVADNKGNTSNAGEPDVTPFCLMIFDCISSSAPSDVAAEIKEKFPRDMYAPYELDDIRVLKVAGNKVVVCAMTSTSKKQIGISAKEVIDNAELYFLTYDGRYSNHIPGKIDHSTPTIGDTTIEQ